MEIFSCRTEDLNLTYVWYNWGFHMITDKTEDNFGKSSDKMIGIQIELPHNWK